jgi:chromate transporter
LNTITNSSGRPGLLHLFLIFLRVGAFTFGGGFAMLPIIQRELVDKQSWLQEEEFIDMIAITQSAPGPIAVNAAAYLGYRLRGLAGAGAAVVGVTLPSLLTIIAIAWTLSRMNLDWLGRIFAGIRPTVVALVASAAYSLGRRALSDGLSWVLLSLTVVALMVLHLHPALVVAIGAIVGLIWRPERSVTR